MYLFELFVKVHSHDVENCHRSTGYGLYCLLHEHWMCCILLCSSPQMKIGQAPLATWAARKVHPDLLDAVLDAPGAVPRHGLDLQRRRHRTGDDAYDPAQALDDVFERLDLIFEAFPLQRQVAHPSARKTRRRRLQHPGWPEGGRRSMRHVDQRAPEVRRRVYKG